MRNLFLCAFLISAHVAAVGQNREMDSLYQALKNHSQEDTIRVNLLLNICYREHTSDPEKNKIHAEEIVRISRKIGFSKGEGGGYRFMSDYYWSIGDYGKATEYAYKTLRVFEAVSNNKGIGRAYQALGRLTVEENGDLEKAKSFYLKGLHYFEKANSKVDVGYCYNSLGVLYYDKGIYDPALEYLQKSLTVREEIQDENGLGQTYGNLAHVYMSQKKYSQALYYFEKSVPIALKLNNLYRLAGVYSGMGEMYMLTGDYKKAEFYLLKSVEIAKGIDQKKMLEQIYERLILLEKTRNQYKAAVKYLEWRASYRDSIYTEEKSKQIAEFETRFETEKKEQAIQLLERDKKIQSIWTNILITAIILLGVLFAVVYFLQRFRERKNRHILNLEIDNLTAQQKELSEKYRNILASGKENSTESVDQRLLKKVIEVVENNIGNPLFGVEEMGKEMAMSRTNLHRKIKAITGFPPSELIRTIRLRKAAILLLHQTNTVSQVSLSVGFEDHSYFSKSFKKQFGVPPSEYYQSKNQQVKSDP